MSFSERYGHKPIKEIIQLDDIDQDLRNGLWSLLKLHCWDNMDGVKTVYGGGIFLNSPSNEEHKNLCRSLWMNYFKKPIDQLNNNWETVYNELRAHFFDCHWYETYDFIEFVANNYTCNRFKEQFTRSCNSLLEKEMSGYRFIDNKITPITDSNEINEIEGALSSSQSPVQKHLTRSLELLSDKSKPDYRNSITTPSPELIGYLPSFSVDFFHKTH